MIDRLDGFTADGFGNIVEGDPQEGDVIRIDDRIEQRYYATVAVVKPEAVPSTTKQEILDIIAALKAKADLLP